MEGGSGEDCGLPTPESEATWTECGATAPGEHQGTGRVGPNHERE